MKKKSQEKPRRISLFQTKKQPERQDFKGQKDDRIRDLGYRVNQERVKRHPNRGQDGLRLAEFFAGNPIDQPGAEHPQSGLQDFNHPHPQQPRAKQFNPKEQEKGVNWRFKGRRN